MMNRILPYLKILRPLNLLMIVVTQFLFWFFVIDPVYAVFGRNPNLDLWQVVLLILATILIAGGGYVVNDYEDLAIDTVNKPDRVLIGRVISESAALNYYMALTLAGLASVLAVSISIGDKSMILFPVILASLLWFYSQSFKKQFLVGNFIVAFETAAVIFLLILYEINWKNVEREMRELGDIIRFGQGYMIFAFLLTMLREVVKDMEDVDGDAEFGCRTAPLVLGMRGAKAVSYLWLGLTVAGLAWLMYVLYVFKNWFAFSYVLICLQLPLIWIAALIARSKASAEFSGISTWIKAVMVLGLVTMIYVGVMMGKYV